MKINLKQLVICIVIPLLVGAVSAVVTQGEMQAFGELNQPALSPPAWLFPVAWSILYILMGIASYLVYRSDAPDDVKGRALLLYGIQLFFNFFWSVIFFNFKTYLFALIWLLILWLMIIFLIRSFYKISKPAAYLLIPYLLWVTFAAYLNWGIYVLN